jgi:hypothetical protein
VRVNVSSLEIIKASSCSRDILADV